MPTENTSENRIAFLVGHALRGHDAMNFDIMNFWAKIVIRYFVVALSALLLALVVSAVGAIAKDGDEELAPLWLGIFFIPSACLDVADSVNYSAALSGDSLAVHGDRFSGHYAVIPCGSMQGGRKSLCNLR